MSTAAPDMAHFSSSRRVASRRRLKMYSGGGLDVELSDVNGIDTCQMRYHGRLLRAREVE